MPLILGAQSAVATGYDIDNSCRFEAASSTSMLKISSAGDQDKWTVSIWVKRATISATQYMTSWYQDNSNFTAVYFEADDTINFLNHIGGATAGKLNTTRVFRDSAAWYHIVAVYDSGNDEAGDRMKLYVNGVEETDFITDTNPSLNADSIGNKSGDDTILGQKGDGGVYLSAYLAEVVLLDGTAAAPTSFGEFDEDSPTIWKPIDVSGLTFGTNGFHCDFEDSANLGNDANGGTDLTETNFVAADQGVDSPTNNFCTVGPSMSPTQATIYKYGNTFVEADNIDVAACCSFGLTTGSWYMEAKATDTANTTIIGLVPAYLINSKPTGMGFDVGSATNSLNVDPSVGLRYNGNIYEKVDGSQVSASSTTFTTGDIIGFSFNLDTGALRFWKDGVEITGSPYTLGDGSYSSTNWVTSGPMLPAFRLDGGGVTILAGWECNFGNGSFGTTIVDSANADDNGYGRFEYAPPSGHLALCSKNLGSDGG